MQVFEFVIMAIFLIMCAAWVIYKFNNNPSVVDMFWSIGLWIAGSLFLLFEKPTHRTVVIQIFLTIWMLRLSAYLFINRVLKSEVDKRYLKISEHWSISKSLGFFLNYQFQGLLILIISSSLYFSGTVDGEALARFDWIGLTLCYIGLVGESLSDMQLNKFIRTNKGKVCNVGLWKYSRHPNYFFEWLVWVGFAITGLPANYGYLAFISPITLYFLMTRITGPITEADSIESKGDLYREYQQKTSMFFPWFPIW